MLSQSLILQAKQADILRLLPNLKLQKIGKAKGIEEYAGPCPFCGGDKRFKVQPTAPGGARWFCRHCTGAPGEAGGHWQSVIDLHMRLTGQDFREAVITLANGAPAPSALPRPEPPPVICTPPPAMWQKQGRAVLERAQECLWGEVGKAPFHWRRVDKTTGQTVTEKITGLEYLHQRGLKDDTIRAAHIGLIPPGPHGKYHKQSGALWGLTGEVTLFPGLVLPCEVGGALWHLEVRLPTDEKGQKYRYLRTGESHSAAAVYLADDLPPHYLAVLTEGKFDALLLKQEVDDLAAVVTIGSANNMLDLVVWGPCFFNIAEVFLAQDDDIEGNKSAAALAWLKNARRVIIPKLNDGDKDLTDYHLSGGDLRNWLQNEIDAYHVEQRLKHLPLQASITTVNNL